MIWTPSKHPRLRGKFTRVLGSHDETHEAVAAIDRTGHTVQLPNGTTVQMTRSRGFRVHAPHRKGGDAIHHVATPEGAANWANRVDRLGPRRGPAEPAPEPFHPTTRSALAQGLWHTLHGQLKVGEIEHFLNDMLRTTTPPERRTAVREAVLALTESELEALGPEVLGALKRELVRAGGGADPAFSRLHLAESALRR